MNLFKKIPTPPRYRLQLEDNSEVIVERIGRGRYTNAYKDIHECSSDVYLDVKEGDWSKEIMSHIQDEAHIPRLEYVGETKRGTLYKSIYYHPLTAIHKEPWAQMKALARCRADAYQEGRRRQWEKIDYEACFVNDKTIELASGEVSQSITDTLTRLTYWTASYEGAPIFEFTKKNLAVDNNGVLVLLDPLFSLEEVRRCRIPRYA